MTHEQGGAPCDGEGRGSVGHTSEDASARAGTRSGVRPLQVVSP